MDNIVDKNQPCHPTWPYMNPAQMSTRSFLKRCADVFKIMSVCDSTRTRDRCERMEQEIRSWLDANKSI